MFAIKNDYVYAPYSYSFEGTVPGNTLRKITIKDGKKDYKLSEDLYQARSGKTFLGHFDLRKEKPANRGKKHFDK